MTTQAAPRASAAIDNLRAIVVLFVLAFHAQLSYLDFLQPHAFAFDAPPFLWRAFPVVDQQRWIGFDLFCAWLDVFLMSFFFLLSGLFVWPSLVRKGPRAFLQERILRLGLPFAVVVGVLMPVALYPVYLQSAADPSIVDYWRHWRALPLWPSGPMWFLWMLLVGDVVAAALFALLRPQRERLLRLSQSARAHPGRFLAGLVMASAVAYVPLALVFGTSDWWQGGPFSFQLSRPLHYAVYFLAGAAIGACGIERGLLAPDGPLPRHWAGWLTAALALFAAWIGLTGLVISEAGAASLWLRPADDLSFVLACFASCFFSLALALRFAAIQWPSFAGLRANAFGMYLVHYIFVVWLQYALLGVSVPAVLKAAIVFAGTVALSWAAATALRRSPAVAQIIGGEKRRSLAAAAPPLHTGGRSAAPGMMPRR